jgi:hypothetical protein
VSSQPTTQSNRTERRWGPRIEVDFPVRLELARGRSTPGRMRNASISGALIECSLELPAFTQLRVEILVAADGLREPIMIPARVVRAEHPRFGVEWRDLAPEAYATLLQASGLATAAR